MRTAGLALLLVMLASSAARAADERGDIAAIGGDPITLRPAGTRRPPALNSPDGESLWRTAGALLAVVAGVGVVLALARRFVPGLSTSSTDRVIQVISQCPLAGKGIVYVIRCGPRVLIVGATANQFTTLAEIADPEEIQQFLSRTERGASSTERTQTGDDGLATNVTGLKDQVHGVLDKIQSWKSST